MRENEEPSETEESANSKDSFKEKLQYWRNNGTPIQIPNNFRAR